MKHALPALFALYFAQGLPFGVQATALPLMLRERGASLQAIGFASLLSLPWLAKALWAPLVDRYGSRRFGRRKSWIAPMQLGLALTALCTGFVDDVVSIAGFVLIMNLFAATQDIAVDALAVSWLKQDQLGPGNAIQVVGYKLGMLTGGGLLVWASAWIGFRGLFLAVSALMFAILVMTVFLHEPDEVVDHERAPVLRVHEIVARVRDAVKSPATAALLVVLLSYKTGESMADGMWKPLLLDRGFTAAQIGLWAGTFGMALSLLGSAGSGWLARTLSLTRVLWWAAALRSIGVAGEWWIASSAQPDAAGVIVVTCLEHFFGGALTTVVFALMMRQTDRQIGATHYTLLASVEVLGKLPLSALSGVVAAWLGYRGLFALSTALCVGFFVLVSLLGTRLDASAKPASAL